MKSNQLPESAIQQAKAKKKKKKKKKNTVSVLCNIDYLLIYKI
jgi:hypothetical protein